MAEISTEIPRKVSSPYVTFVICGSLCLDTEHSWRVNGSNSKQFTPSLHTGVQPSNYAFTYRLIDHTKFNIYWHDLQPNFVLKEICHGTSNVGVLAFTWCAPWLSESYLIFVHELFLLGSTTMENCFQEFIGQFC